MPHIRQRDRQCHSTATLLAGQSPAPTKKGTGFVQPLQPHEHWHVDVSYLNIAGTFYFLCSVLDGCSRFSVHGEIRDKMEESNVETILQRAREAFPNASPRIITDNGPQFIAKDFKESMRIAVHVDPQLFHCFKCGKSGKMTSTTAARPPSRLPTTRHSTCATAYT